MSLDINSRMNANTATCIRLTLGRFPQVRQIWTWADWPDHNNGRCVDLMVTIPNMARADQVALGNAIAQWWIDHADQLGLNWLIWNHRIYRHQNTNRGHGWAPYTGTNPHEDHVHVEQDGSRPNMPQPWDGTSFPGASAFVLGQSHPAVTLLGQRLVVHGYDKHHDGDGYQPGPVFTEYDQANVQDFQLAQGWTGDGADGIPGPQTWDALAADPVPAPEPEPTPEPEPEPEPVLTEATVMSFNLQGGQRSTFDKRLPLIVKAIKAVNPSVILAQECSDDDAAKVNAELGSRWHYRTDDTNDNVGNTIFYRDDWVDNGKKQIPLPTPHSGPGGYPRGLLRVALNHAKTGERLWVFTTHFTATGWPSTMTPEQASAERAAQAKAVAAYLATYRYFVLGGDFNTSNRVAFTSVGNYPLSTMGGIANRDQASFDSSATPGRWIDDLIIHSNGEASGVEFVSGGLHLTGGASDHNAPYAVIRLRPRKEQP